MSDFLELSIFKDVLTNEDRRACKIFELPKELLLILQEYVSIHYLTITCRHYVQMRRTEFVIKKLDPITQIIHNENLIKQIIKLDFAQTKKFLCNFDEENAHHYSLSISASVYSYLINDSNKSKLLSLRSKLNRVNDIKTQSYCGCKKLKNLKKNLSCGVTLEDDKYLSDESNKKKCTCLKVCPCTKMNSDCIRCSILSNIDMCRF